MLRFLRRFAALAVTTTALVSGAVHAQVENTTDCYRLSSQAALINALAQATVAKRPLTITVAVDDRDVAQYSGSQAEWENAARNALTLWSDALRQDVAKDGITIPPVQVVFGNIAVTPVHDVRLVIHKRGVTTAPGVPDLPDADARPKYMAYVAKALENDSLPVVNVFPSVIDFGKGGAQRVQTQQTLLNHEMGHVWGLRDLYDENAPAGVRRALQGYSACTAHLMFRPRSALNKGDRLGIVAKFVAALRGGGGLRALAFGADQFEDGRVWLANDDDMFGLPISVAAGGYLLDGDGGVHAFGGAPAVNTTGAPYWPGWDIARALTVLPDASGGWILDGWGGIHNFGSAPPLPLPAYWANWDIARDLVVLAKPTGGYMGYVLDGWGGLHPFGGAPTFPQQNQRLLPGQYSAAMVYHAGQDSAVGLMLTYDTPGLSLPTGGMVLDRSGMLTRFGLYGAAGDYHYWDSRFPLLSRAVNWRKFVIVDGAGFYAIAPAQAATSYQNLLQSIGAPDALSVPNPWGGWDIIRDVVSHRPSCVPTSSPTCLQ